MFEECEHFHCQKSVEARRREGVWQQESPYKEELELVRHSSDLHFEVLLMRRAYYAGKSDDWESYLEVFWQV